MGIYFNPPQRLPEIGRKLQGSTFQELNAQIQPGEVLIGLYQRPLFMNAPHLYNEGEFDEFESQHNSGIIRRVGFFAIPEVEL
jgi:hypothetical protein